MGRTQSPPLAADPAPPRDCPGAVVIGGAHGSLAVARSLGRRGIPVWFFNSGHPIARFSRYVRRSPAWPASAADQVECLLETGARNQLRGWTLFPGGDPEAELLSRHGSTLAEFFRLTTPPWEVMRWANDKRLTYRLAGDLDIPHPWTYYPKGRDDVAALKGPFPMILKPAFKEPKNAFTRAKAWRVNSRRELLARYDQACSLVNPDIVMLQEFVPGSGDSQLSYAALWGQHGPVASLVARRLRQYPVDFGYFSTFVETTNQPEVSLAAERLLSAMNYTGLVEVEFKYDAREHCYKLLDINGRVWAWTALGRRAGIDFPYLMWLQSQGEPVPECHARTGVRWLHFSRDFVAAMLEIRRGTLSASAYLRSLRGPREFAVFAADDPLPAVLDLPLLAVRLIHRMRA